MNLTELFGPTATEWIGRSLGLRQTLAIERVDLSLAAWWARGGAVWVLFGCLGVTAVVAWFYARCQGRRRGRARIALAIMRAALLCLLVVILAEPILTMTLLSRRRPVLWLLVDGTDSMNVADELPAAEQRRLADAVGLPADESSKPLTRAAYVKALVRKKENNLLDRLEEKCRLRVFEFDRPRGVRALDVASKTGEGIDRARLADQLTSDGQVTALGAALDDLGRHHATANLAGVLVVSDFNENTGVGAVEAARRLGVKIHTVGVGPAAAADVSVDLQTPLVMKKDERSTLAATLRQEGLTGRTATVKFFARPSGTSGEAADARAIGERSVLLDGPTETVELAYTPEQTGAFTFVAQVEPIDGEAIPANNRAEREATVRDDFLRLLFVAYEPSWEWRFIKEVFHRDKLVGMRGFRTYLRSADREVREANPLFVSALTPPRSEFFAHDVILLGDMPASALSSRFCEMTKEFVGEFGGGLVVLAGPRFGVGELAETPLADLLPVKVYANTRPDDRKPFAIKRTFQADGYDFMRLGADARENEKAWANLGPIPWYQPVDRLSPMATALAVHPTDTCVDGKTPQPLIAAQYYGRGEVIYLGFDEMWRLRRKFGERYYRQFWGQMIHRLALRHALGKHKRFVVRSDRRRYRADDQVLVTVEAYSSEFEPLTENDLPEGKLSAELIPPGRGSVEPSDTRPLDISQLRDGVFEARIPVFLPGEHRLRVKDPITGEYAEVAFKVASVSAERRSAVRNVALQKAVAAATGGTTCDLAGADRLADRIELSPKTERTVRVVPLWNTWAVFGVVVFLMLGEWFGRKWVNLS